MELFAYFCVSTGGLREKALARLGAGNLLANRLADARVQQLQGGRPGGVAWAIRSPRNAELLLEYDARGICGVRVAEADERSIQRLFEAEARDTAQKASAKLVKPKNAVTVKQGARLTSQDLFIELDGQRGHFGLTSSDRRLGDLQHFMTFALVK